MLVRFGVRSVTGALFKILMLWALIAASGCTWLDTRQRQIIYRPTPSLPHESADSGLGRDDVRFFRQVPSSDQQQRIELWWLPHADPGAPTLLYLHGTFRNLSQNKHKIDALREAGFAVLAVDYRGWGQSTAITPSEQTILQDAQLAWAELTQREPRPDQRVIYGHSMGSGVAVDLASGLATRTDYGALILESAFTSFADIAREAGFWARVLSWFSTERFASIDKIARVQAPVLMIHGQQDRTIPIALGQQLFAAVTAPKQWLAVEKGQHSDLDLVAPELYQAVIRAFKTRYLLQPP
jgi:pimeloyl-ACP methyl ester carboxylesterase